MVASIIISLITVLGIVITSIVYPTIKIGKVKLNLYWIISLLGLVLILVTLTLSPNELFDGLTRNDGINPLQILVLFISMSVISIYLDEVGFFSYIASIVIKKWNKNQITIFVAFYILVSLLTMFTSNDIVILTLTPFIIFFCKNGKINPLPYLISEFIAANTWSMMFIIGNPTNIYLAGSFNVSFIDYLSVMWLPTLVAGLVELGLLYLIFRKTLKEPINNCDIEISSFKKGYTIIGLTILIICTILLVISSYINIPMYLISACALGVLIIVILIYGLISKDKPLELLKTVKRSPLEIIPFVIGMFSLVLALNKFEVTSKINDFFGNMYPEFKYGYSSLFMANFINNIPMSVLYSSIIGSSFSLGSHAMYASVIGSNLGAFISPIGALAGIMWMGILKNHDIKFSYIDFIKYGLPIGLITATSAFLMLFVL